MFKCPLFKAQEMQSALKKQEKVWKTRMQKLRASYLDQLKDVGYNDLLLRIFHLPITYYSQVNGQIAVPGAKST